eukprot:CAMPEP_0172683062 /NCGR_PEP_ID=MMETSP1074-20121228/18591_1 /TAXON_ID=2916 /ORGANISM="Ceratium fusus, Strain PA161109" /LENGTH=121 /DNA_ID=CAMNT_0013501851 /DNA_START=515 /DNA_END=880 /DNA_ORIENTATION=-
MLEMFVLANLWLAQQLKTSACISGNFVHCLLILTARMHHHMDCALDMHHVTFHGLVLAPAVLNVKRRVADFLLRQDAHPQKGWHILLSKVADCVFCEYAYPPKRWLAHLDVAARVRSLGGA